MLLRTSLLLVALSTASVAGQAPSAWTERVFPTTVQLTNIDQRGKVMAYREGATIHGYSAMTRSWHSLPSSAAAQIRVANDLILVEDGTRISAFASYSGHFTSITVSPAARVINPGNQNNDSIILVHDGTDLWAFSGFLGQWTRRTVSAGAQCAVQRHTALVADGNQLLGMGAFRSRWIATAMAGTLASIHADGTVGVATTSTTVYGFSALRESWKASASLGATAQFSISDDVAVWWDGISYLAFSGLRGSFQKVVAGVLLAVQVSDQLVVAWKNNQFWFYSACTGNWIHSSLNTTPTVVVESSQALLVEPTVAHGYSATRGTLSSTPIQALSWRMSATVTAALDSAGRGAMFSTLLGAWSQIPNDATANPPRVASTGALIQHRSGFYAYSARTGTFHSLASGATAIPHVDGSSAILAVEDTSHLHVFDPRRHLWLSEPLVGNGLQVHLWRTSFVAQDGPTSAIGYGAFHGRIERHSLTGTLRELRSNSESGRVVTDTHLLTFSAVPLLSSPWQFPEFRRTFSRGADLDFHLSANAAMGQAYLALGVQPPFTLPGLGEVLLDANFLLPIAVPLDARTGTARTSVNVPDLPGLQGTEVFLQGLVLPVAGAPYITDVASVLLF